MKIKKGDLVVVTTGDDITRDEKGRWTPKRVLSVIDEGSRVVVEGVRRAFKHVRRGHPKSPQGGRLQVEMPIDASNVRYYCGSCNTPTRLGYRYAADGAKERFCRKCGASAGTISPPRPQYAKQS